MIPRLRVPVRLAVFILGALALAAIPNTALWYIETTQAAEATTFVVDIPAGTAEQIAQGAAPPSLPARLSFAAGERVRIRNDDLVAHQIGSILVAPGSESIVPAAIFSGANRFVCSFHAGGSINVDVSDSGSVWLIIPSTLLVGLPLGAIGFGIVTLASRLGS